MYTQHCIYCLSWQYHPNLQVKEVMDNQAQARSNYNYNYYDYSLTLIINFCACTYSVWGYLRALEVVEVVMEVTVSLPKLELL